MQIQQRIASSIALLTLASFMMLIVVIGLIFLAIGFYFLLVPAVGHGSAGLIVGASLIASILLLLLIGMLVARTKSRRREKMRQRQEAAEREELEQQLRAVLGDQTLDWAKRHQKLAVGGALAAGVALSVNPRTRRLVSDAVTPLLSRRAMDILRTLDEDPPRRRKGKR